MFIIIPGIWYPMLGQLWTGKGVPFGTGSWVLTGIFGFAPAWTAAASIAICCWWASIAICCWWEANGETIFDCRCSSHNIWNNQHLGSKWFIRHFWKERHDNNSLWRSQTWKVIETICKNIWTWKLFKKTHFQSEKVHYLSILSRSFWLTMPMYLFK